MSHILIVEDEPDIGGAFEKFLHRMGHTCDVVLDGRTAYNKVFLADYDYECARRSLGRGDGHDLT